MDSNTGPDLIGPDLTDDGVTDGPTDGGLTRDDLTDDDLDRLRDAIAASVRAVEHGNHPFGAVLTDGAGTVVLEAENTVVTDTDITGHAETNLVREAWRRFGPGTLADHTLYTSCEPCPMCAGAIYWAGVGRMVFAMSAADLAGLTGDDATHPTMSMSSSEVLNSGSRTVEVAGPALVAEATAAHAGFWGAGS